VTSEGGVRMGDKGDVVFRPIAVPYGARIQSKDVADLTPSWHAIPEYVVVLVVRLVRRSWAVRLVLINLIGKRIRHEKLGCEGSMSLWVEAVAHFEVDVSGPSSVPSRKDGLKGSPAV